MDPVKLSLSSIALDLNRVALGLHRGSSMATRFAHEALARRDELATNKLPLYIRNLLYSLDSSVKDADSALMTSVLFQNYCSQI